MREPLTLAGSKIKPGQRATIQVPVARLYTHTEMTMPVHVIHGRKEGPRLFVSAAIHGDEIIGTEIIRRLMKLKKIKKDLYQIGNTICYRGYDDSYDNGQSLCWITERASDGAPGGTFSTLKEVENFYK